MKAIIIYENFGDAVAAKAALQRCADNAGLVGPWDIRPWRIDMLRFAPTAAEALTEAIDAHLIVFAGRTAQFFAYRLEMWLEHWAKCRRIQEAALAVMGGAEATLDASSAGEPLAAFAKRHQLELISHEDAEFECTPRFTDDSLRYPAARNQTNLSVVGS